VINCKSLIVPQTKVYLAVLGFSSLQFDNDTFQEYLNETSNDDYIYKNDNPNFFQRYYNRSWTIGITNYHMASYINVLGETYFNVTVHNNSSFPVEGVVLFGQLPNGGSYINDWYDLADYVLYPKDTCLSSWSGKTPDVRLYNRTH
jgi:hypothetical protein